MRWTLIVRPDKNTEPLSYAKTMRGRAWLRIGAGLLAFAAMAWLAATQFAAAESANAQNRAWLFNSDTLTHAALYQDLFVDGYDPREWRMSGSLYWFPGGALYFAWRALLGHPVPAHYAYLASLLLFSCLALASVFAWMLRQSFRELAPWTLFGGALWLAAPLAPELAPFAQPDDGFDVAQLVGLAPVYHGSAWLAALLVARCAIGYLQSGRAGWLIGLVSLAVSTVASLPIALAWLVLPALAVSALLALRPSPADPRARRRALVLLGAFLGSAVAGRALLQMLVELQWIRLADGVRTLNQKAKHFTLADLPNAIGEMLEQLLSGLSPFLLGMMLLAIGAYALLLGRASVSAPAHARFALYWPGAVAVFAAGLAAAAAWAGYENRLQARFWTPLVLLALSGGGMALGAILGAAVQAVILRQPDWSRESGFLRRLHGAVWPLFAALLLFAWSVAGNPWAAPEQVFANPDALVECADDAARKYNLRYGLGGYWDAKRIQTLSATGLRVNQIDSTFAPYYFASNFAWFLGRGDSAPEYDFFVARDPGVALAEGALPPARLVIACEKIDARIYVYDRPGQDDAFRRRFRRAELLLWRRMTGLE